MNWVLALPEIVLAVLGIAILMFGVLVKRQATLFCNMFVLGALLIAAFLVIITPSGVGYDGLFISDTFSRFVILLMLCGAGFSLMLSFDYNRQEGIKEFEFPILMLFAVVGMMVMISAANLMTLYLGLELQLIALYVVTAFQRESIRSSEAALKYFILGALASGLLLYGISLVYGFTGSTSFHALAAALRSPGGVSAGLVLGVVFIIAGLVFEVSAVPFHMWTPDVYEGAPTPVTVFIGTAPKVAGMAILIRTMATPFGQLAVDWRLLIEIVSIGSMVLGTLAAIGQTNFKRLMAYSAISHMGYTLIGLAAGTEAGLRGALVYLVVYVFMSLGIFAGIIAMRRRGVTFESIYDLAGLAHTDRGLAFAFAIFLFSMAGIPPLSGFFGKLYVFLAAVQAGMWTLAVIGVLTSVAGAYYYINIVKVMYMDPRAPAIDARPAMVSFVAVVTGLFTVFFFLFSGPIVAGAQAAAQVLLG